MEELYDDYDDVGELGREVDSVREREGNFRAGKAARNQAGNRKRPSRSPKRPASVPPARAALVPPPAPPVMSPDDLYLDASGRLSRRVGLVAALKKPSNSATGMHAAVLVIMHGTNTTAVVDGAVQMSCRAMNNTTLQVIWHERTDRPMTELLPRLQEENGPGFEGRKYAQQFMTQCKTVIGSGFSELDSVFDTMKPNAVSDLYVNLISPEPIDTDPQHWACVACGLGNRSKMFVIPLTDVVKAQELEFGLNAV
jgi:hypothetical protein